MSAMKPGALVRWMGEETDALKQGHEFMLVRRTPVDGEWFALNESDVLGRLDERDVELVSDWHVFDKDDETSHPPKRGQDYWTCDVFKTGTVYVGRSHWNANPSFWPNTRYWQEITLPSPPQEVK